MRGTGTGGRITANDVLAAAREGPAAAVGAAILDAPVARRPAYSAPVLGQTIPLTQARRIIAERMVESKRTIPHAWTMVEVDVTGLWKWRVAERTLSNAATASS